MDEPQEKLTLEILNEWLKALGAAEGGPMFRGKPDRWWDTPTWRCLEGHVSTMFLKTELTGDVCLACLTPILLTFPEDADGPLEPN